MQHECSTAMTALRILEILKETDSKHPLTQAQIGKILGFDRKTIGRTIAIMETEIPGFQVGRCSDGVYYEKSDSDFDLYEVRMLIDSVLSCRFLDMRQTKLIVKKLGLLINKRDRGCLHNIHTYSKYFKTDHPDTMLNVDLLGDAINNRRQIIFTYYSYDRKKQLTPVGDYQVSPYQLAFSGGFYMVLCKIDEESAVHPFRLDLMRNIITLDSPSRLSADLYIHPESEASAYVEGHPYMQVGNTEWIEAVISETAICRAIDAFGHGIRIVDTKEQGEVGLSFRANTEDVYLWALQNADAVTVISPHSLRERLKNAGARIEAKYQSPSGGGFGGGGASSNASTGLWGYGSAKPYRVPKPTD